MNKGMKKDVFRMKCHISVPDGMLHDSKVDGVVLICDSIADEVERAVKDKLTNEVAFLRSGQWVFELEIPVLNYEKE